MRIGHHLLTFESKTVTQNNFGEPVDTWATAFRVRGSFQAVGSREFPATEKRNSETTARFIVWYRADLDSLTASDVYRIVFNRRTWNIYAPAPQDSKPIGRYSVTQEGGTHGGFVYLEIEASEIH